MSDERRASSGDTPGEPGAPDDDDDRAIADLVARIRRSDDPTASLLRPLSEAERRAMSEQVLASLGAKVTRLPTPAASATRRRLAWLLPLAAALTLVVLFLLIPRGGGALVAYRLDLEGDALVRGDHPDGGAAGEPVKLRPETRLRAHLAPAQPARDVSLRLVVVRGGKATVISPPAMQDGQGGFTVDELAGKLLGEQVDGPVELCFALGRPLPDDEALARLALDPSASLPASLRIERRAALLTGFSPKQGALGWSGCKGVRAGPVCEVGRGAALTVWAEGADAGRFSLRVDGVEVNEAPVPVEGGLRFRVEPPREARLLTLSLTGRELLRLPLEAAAEAPRVDAADALRREGKLAEAEDRLIEAERDPAARLPALRVRAKIARKRGDGPRAAALRDEAIAAGRAAGRVSDEVDDQLARIFDLLYQESALAEAGRRLDTLGALDAGDAEDRLKIAYYRGLIAAELGDSRTAIASLGAARLAARRQAVPVYETAVAGPLADLLVGLGRHDEAAAILAEMVQGLAAMADGCDRAHLVTDHGWVLLRAGHLAEATPRLEEAARLAREGCPRVLGDTLTNLAFARLEGGAAGEARALLAQARAAKEGPNALTDAWLSRLSIELLLADDPRAALLAAEELQRAGERSLSPELGFEAELGRARALDRLGDTPAATQAYAAAERALDAWGALVPLGEGRQAFFDRQERGARAWVGFLQREAARAGASAAASLSLASAARRSVARFYRVLGEGDLAGARGAEPDGAYASALGAYRAARARADAALAGGRPPASADLAALRDGQSSAASTFTAAQGAPLRAPAEGELDLVYHPLPEGWLGIGWTAAGVAWKLLGPIDPTAGAASLAASLIEPFRALVERATLIRIHAHARLAEVPFHALPWDGGLLLDRAPLVYALDLPASPASSAACAGAPTALVVADAREDLAGAGSSVAALQATLTARGYTVRLLRGAEARLAPVSAALADPCVALFHYEGHAVFQGRDGVDASLLLADGRLRASDVLRLPRVPRVAVLSGCSTAEASGLGLAQAFLARGAAQVLATTAPVDDLTAARVGQRLYAAPSPAGEIPPRLAEGWKAAFPLLREAGADARDLRAYRVLGR
jgi:hypothetical protein